MASDRTVYRVLHEQGERKLSKDEQKIDTSRPRRSR